MKQEFKKEIECGHQNTMHIKEKFKDDHRFANKAKTSNLFEDCINDKSI